MTPSHIPQSVQFTHLALRSQQGATLVVALVMLLLVLLLGISGMRVITEQTRITANVIEQRRLSNAAEGALRAGERLITHYAKSLTQCSDGRTPAVDTTNGKAPPCHQGDAMSDGYGLKALFEAKKSAQVLGFERQAYWYPRYITTVCPKGHSATSALDASAIGCTEFYEVNAQATPQKDAQACGANAYCLRSTLNMLIK